jgi:hypothetical protein
MVRSVVMGGQSHRPAPPRDFAKRRAADGVRPNDCRSTIRATAEQRLERWQFLVGPIEDAKMQKGTRNEASPFLKLVAGTRNRHHHRLPPFVVTIRSKRH